MAYFVKVGAIPKNAGGVGSRGYHVYRRGRRVFTVWGPIDVYDGRQVFWASTTQHQIIRCGSEKAAVRKRAELINLRTEQRGYSRLPMGAGIRRRAWSRRSVLMKR